jgi:polysaccharide export outer membrane protein
MSLRFAIPSGGALPLHGSSDPKPITPFVLGGLTKCFNEVLLQGIPRIGIPFALSVAEVYTMNQWVRCASCLLLLLAGVVLETRAQTPKAPAQPLAHAESYGEGEYRIGAEDVIEVFVANEDTLSVTTVVRPDGKITMKLVGELVAKGKTAKELGSEIEKRIVDYIEPAPTINVVVKEINSPKISVFGEVRKPDVYSIKQKTSVFEAIALGGGFGDFANRKKVIVLREGRKIELNLEAMLRGKDRSMFYIEPGDTVYVQ